jgi:hypothetical protein
MLYHYRHSYAAICEILCVSTVIGCCSSFLLEKSGYTISSLVHANPFGVIIALETIKRLKGDRSEMKAETDNPLKH